MLHNYHYSCNGDSTNLIVVLLHVLKYGCVCHNPIVLLKLAWHFLKSCLATVEAHHRTCLMFETAVTVAIGRFYIAV